MGIREGGSPQLLCSVFHPLLRDIDTEPLQWGGLSALRASLSPTTFLMREASVHHDPPGAHLHLSFVVFMGIKMEVVARHQGIQQQVSLEPDRWQVLSATVSWCF